MRKYNPPTPKMSAEPKSRKPKIRNTYVLWRENEILSGLKTIGIVGDNFNIDLKFHPNFKQSTAKALFGAFNVHFYRVFQEKYGVKCGRNGSNEFGIKFSITRLDSDSDKLIYNIKRIA